MIELDKYIQFRKLNNKSDVIHLYTKKPFNFNKKIIDDKDIYLQYEEIQNILNYKFKKIIKPLQEHTNIVKKVDDLNDNFEGVDGLITNIRGIALVTSLADCQSILLFDHDKQVIGNIHSGWKGTLNRIIENAINIMVNEYECNVRNIEVYICPSILNCCFEVDNDVKEKFILKFQDIKIQNFIIKGDIKDNRQKYYIDTVLINKEILKKLGILEQNIYCSDMCTKCNNEKFHSYREERDKAGRNIALIALK